jgi:hypothetical protein
VQRLGNGPAASHQFQGVDGFSLEHAPDTDTHRHSNDRRHDDVVA